MRQVEDPDLLVLSGLFFFVCGFDKRNSSGGAPSNPRNQPAAAPAAAGSTDRAPNGLYSNPHPVTNGGQPTAGEPPVKHSRAWVTHRCPFIVRRFDGRLVLA